MKAARRAAAGENLNYGTIAFPGIFVLIKTLL
jgi:hypothetical protein